MSDREKIARALHDHDWPQTWSTESPGVRALYELRADAVLAVLPSEGWEQAGWSCAACGPHFRSRSNWCAVGCGRDYNRMEPVYRRVDGAAPGWTHDHLGRAVYRAPQGEPTRPPGVSDESAAAVREVLDLTRERMLVDGAAPPSYGEFVEAADAENMNAITGAAPPEPEQMCGECGAPRSDHSDVWAVCPGTGAIEHPAALSGQQDTTEAHDG